MPKADFEFFEVSDLPEPLVLPRLASDPYEGIFAPEEGAFVQAIIDDVSTGTNVDLAPFRVEGPRRAGPFQYLERATETAGPPVHREHAEFLLPLSLLDVTDQETVYELYKAGASIRWAGELADRTPVAHRTFDIHAFTARSDGKPSTPRIDIFDRLSVRAFTWSPGPIRDSASKERLAPTYNPRPYPISVIASVSIRFAEAV